MAFPRQLSSSRSALEPVIRSHEGSAMHEAACQMKKRNGNRMMRNTGFRAASISFLFSLPAWQVARRWKQSTAFLECGTHSKGRSRQIHGRTNRFFSHLILSGIWGQLRFGTQREREEERGRMRKGRGRAGRRRMECVCSHGLGRLVSFPWTTRGQKHARSNEKVRVRLSAPKMMTRRGQRRGCTLAGENQVD